MNSRTTIVYRASLRPARLRERLPAGDYDIETELSAPPDHRDPARWQASVMLKLHPGRPIPD